MRLSGRKESLDAEGSVIRFVSVAQFRQEANALMATMAGRLSRLERKRGGDPVLVDAISRDMAEFHRLAALRGLDEIAGLAWHVAQALEHVDPARGEAARRVVALSLAAVSQIRWLLNPSVEGAGENARRILAGLFQKW